MFCKHCGNQMNDKSVYCSNCGKNKNAEYIGINYDIAIPNKVSPPKVRKKLKWWHILLILLCAAPITILLIFIIMALAGDSDSKLMYILLSALRMRFDTFVARASTGTPFLM